MMLQAFSFSVSIDRREMEEVWSACLHVAILLHRLLFALAALQKVRKGIMFWSNIYDVGGTHI
jgi:hypothetical protein